MQASRCSVWRDAVICGGVEVNQSSGTAVLHQSQSFGPGQPSISPALAALTRATVGTCCTGEEETDVRPREHSVRAASQSPAARNASWGRWPSVIGSAVTAHRNCSSGMAPNSHRECAPCLSAMRTRHYAAVMRLLTLFVPLIVCHGVRQFGQR